MNRRELLKMITVATGAALVGGNSLLAFSASDECDRSFSAEDVQRLDELAETILPRTDTPGAKDAEVGAFMTVFVSACYTPEERSLFHQGLAQLDARSRAAYERGFLNLESEQRRDLIAELDREARAQVEASGEPHYFTLMKQLTLFGFFTSEVGATEVLRYEAVPGRYDGCMPYEEGEPAWAT
ncbi:gluconate 2-dehydrogenase subunit 3 family protein [Billgrantia bachuensis]|uniref:Gluconate 2-dehydrogenase subunit 3 family protein n=1 Tax=Billgrantia bachuensis TaxID=2717286 RepID=A0ABX0PXW1_9GAMM|nr:gluconate 2-dehydrogenase subunit 3 family protein [Halomonas bachuensis]NIC07315.1 gluconate 2-dehydrogenase subunit 3 family protein [Halomonas bachuensis]